MRRTAIALTLGTGLVLAGCATIPRLYSENELSTVSRACGLAAGELVQEEEEPRLVFLFRQGPSRSQVSCVRDWSRKRKLTLALVEMNWTDNAASH